MMAGDSIRGAFRLPWSAEGLLPFLTGKSQDTLFGHSAGDIWYDDHDRTEPADWFRRRG